MNIIRSLRLIGLMVVIAAFGVSAVAQNKEPALTPQSSCSRDNVLSLIHRQVDLSKTIDSDAKRITLNLRAADLMWTAEQAEARATFTDAFDLATRLFKEKGAADTSDGRLRVQGVDHRYTVITAIAKRDSAWARKLSRQILDEEAAAEAAKAEDQAAKEKAETNPQAARTSEKLMGIALGLLGADQQTAMQFARSTLQYPATLYTPFFLFKLSESNRSLADQFYTEALAAYSRAPMDQFLYLSSYPFAANREIGEMPMWTTYQVPNGLAPNPTLQRLFVATLLGRARELIQNPVTPRAGTRWTEQSQVFMALSRVEPLIAASQPDIAAQIAEEIGR